MALTRNRGKRAGRASYTTDRNYIFLFCNGILVFLIRNSVLASENQMPVPESSEKRAVAREEAVGIEQEKERGNENLIAEKGKENEILPTQQQEDEEEGGLDIIKEEEFFEEEGMELLSAEELNKKCDEFIRKMREGIKFEAQVMVYSI
ncbi:uncharacterized protein LOC130789761 [Actinidia eriantha]|uniref:uncharacterized protein LOC130789761 n=1 Tax=Actinidia eriantha TaxID=165200 RepID=UPI00258DB12B|nr:uncharacterized protein LOC130789761 [Actinidia eriantha]